LILKEKIKSLNDAQSSETSETEINTKIKEKEKNKLDKITHEKDLLNEEVSKLRNEKENMNVQLNNLRMEMELLKKHFATQTSTPEFATQSEPIKKQGIF